MKEIFLPHNDQSEWYYLASLLDPIDGKKALSNDDLSPEDFHSTDSMAIYRAIKEMFVEGRPIDSVTLCAQSKVAYNTIEHICKIFTDEYTAGEHAKIIKTLSLRRKVIKETEALQQAAISEETQIEELTIATERLYTEVNSDILSLSTAKNRAELIRPSTLVDNMINFNADVIRVQGVRTAWASLSDHYRPAKGTLNIVSGIPSHGKSEFMDALALQITESAKWKWCFFSPENYPTELHLQKLLEKILGRSISSASELEIRDSMKYIDDYFRFVKLAEDKHGLSDLMALINKPVKSGEFDAVVIDPYNELDTKSTDERETDVIGRNLSQLRRFARRNNVAVFVVAHPAKMYKDKNSTVYNVPTLYDLAGSAHWYNRADNGLTIYRNFDTNTIDIHIQKIKYKIHGKIGLVSMVYDRDNGRFSELPEQLTPTQRIWID